MEEIHRLGRRGLLVRADVAQRLQVEAMVKTVVDRFGRLDTLVNSAATTVFIHLAGPRRSQ